MAAAASPARHRLQVFATGPAESTPCAAPLFFRGHGIPEGAGQWGRRSRRAALPAAALCKTCAWALSVVQCRAALFRPSVRGERRSKGIAGKVSGAAIERSQVRAASAAPLTSWLVSTGKQSLLARVQQAERRPGVPPPPPPRTAHRQAFTGRAPSIPLSHDLCSRPSRIA